MRQMLSSCMLDKTTQAQPTFFLPPTNLWVILSFRLVNHLCLAFCLARRSPSPSLPVDWINVAFILPSCREASTQHDAASTSMAHNQHDVFEFVTWTVWCLWNVAFSPIAKNIQFGLIRRNNLFRVTLEFPTWPCASASVEMFFDVCFVKYSVLINLLQKFMSLLKLTKMVFWNAVKR